MYICVCFIVFCFIFKYSKCLRILKLQLSWWFEPFENVSGLCWFVRYVLGKCNLSGGESLWTSMMQLCFKLQIETFQCYRKSDDYLSCANSCLKLKVCNSVHFCFVELLILRNIVNSNYFLKRLLKNIINIISTPSIITILV